MKRKVMRSNDAHERLENYNNDKKVQLQIISRKRWLTDEELTQKSIYEIKERYHKKVAQAQLIKDEIVPYENRRAYYNKLWREYFNDNENKK